MTIRVYDIAHARAGDKGNTSNISVTAYDDEGWQVIPEESNGVRLRYRVRHVNTRLLTTPPTTGTGPVLPARTG